MAKTDMRWGVERRPEFIGFRLFGEGHVNRSDLMEAFGVSVNQAFDARFLNPDAGRYLSQRRSVSDGIVDAEGTWIKQFPAFDAAPTPVRKPQDRQIIFLNTGELFQ